MIVDGQSIDMALIGRCLEENVRNDGLEVVGRRQVVIATRGTLSSGSAV